MPNWGEMRSVYSVRCGVSLVSSQWVWGTEPSWTQVMMTGLKLGLEQDLHLSMLSREDDRLIYWQSDILWSLPLSCFSFLAVCSADRERERQQLKVSKKAWRKKNTFNQIYGKHKEDGWAVGAQLRHRCLLRWGPIRELPEVVGTKQIVVVVCVQRVRAIFTSTWGAQSNMWTHMQRQNQTGTLRHYYHIF